MKNIVMISGGVDSTTMADLLCKNGYPIDYIVFTNTLMEHTLMYEYIEKLKTYFKERYNKKIIVTKPKTTFEAWCFGVIKDKTSKCDGYIRGIPMVWAEPCYWKRESKAKPFDEDIFKELNITNATVYIGYTVGENRSVENPKNITYKYPLKDIFKMNGSDCQSYLEKQEMENPLYKYFTRTGCSICTGQSDRAWFQVWKNFPKIWEYMKFVEQKLLSYEKMGMKVKNAYWFTKYRTCEYMEKKFKKSDKQKGLMDFSDDPLKNCFCKI